MKKIIGFTLLVVTLVVSGLSIIYPETCVKYIDKAENFINWEWAQKSRIEKARECMRTGDLDGSIKYLRRALIEDKNNIEVYLYYGEHLLFCSNAEGAMWVLDGVLAKRPELEKRVNKIYVNFINEPSSKSLYSYELCRIAKNARMFDSDDENISLALIEHAKSFLSHENVCPSKIANILNCAREITPNFSGRADYVLMDFGDIHLAKHENYKSAFLFYDAINGELTRWGVAKKLYNEGKFLYNSWSVVQFLNQSIKMDDCYKSEIVDVYMTMGRAANTEKEARLFIKNACKLDSRINEGLEVFEFRRMLSLKLLHHATSKDIDFPDNEQLELEKITGAGSKDPLIVMKGGSLKLRIKPLGTSPALPAGYDVESKDGFYILFPPLTKGRVFELKNGGKFNMEKEGVIFNHGEEDIFIKIHNSKMKRIL